MTNINTCTLTMTDVWRQAAICHILSHYHQLCILLTGHS